MSSHIRILAQDPNFSLLFHLATPSFLPLLLPHTFPQGNAWTRQMSLLFTHTHKAKSLLRSPSLLLLLLLSPPHSHERSSFFACIQSNNNNIWASSMCVCVHMLCFCWCCVFSTLILIAWHWLRTRRQQSSRAEQQHSFCYCAVTNGTLRNMACVASLCIT